MNIKLRLTALSFFQFFVWGAWLTTLGTYGFGVKKWSGEEFGIVFMTLGIASIVMPPIIGMIADRWVNAERLLGICHIMGAIILFLIPTVDNPTTFFWVMLLNMIFYMPTISLANTVSYTALKNENKNIIKDFPPIRVWGTIGFIVAMWIVSLLHIETSASQFYVASVASLALGVYSFTLPKCPPLYVIEKGRSFVDTFGLKAFSLFKDIKMAMFFIFAMLLGAALQLTNAYGDTFLHDFAKVDAYKDAIAVKYPAIIMSISQMSETVFILAIPFMLRKFGIKKVMLFSMFAWVLRFGLFAYGNPAEGLWMIVLSCIIYGLAFDFFNISGSLFVDSQCDSKIRASAQGLFMMMTNGFGALLGSSVSGVVIDKFYTLSDGSKDWHGIWIAFSVYSLVVAIAFGLLFRHKHDPKALEALHH